MRNKFKTAIMLICLSVFTLSCDSNTRHNYNTYDYDDSYNRPTQIIEKHHHHYNTNRSNNFFKRRERRKVVIHNHYYKKSRKRR